MGGLGLAGADLGGGGRLGAGLWLSSCLGSSSESKLRKTKNQTVQERSFNSRGHKHLEDSGIKRAIIIQV